MYLYIISMLAALAGSALWALLDQNFHSPASAGIVSVSLAFALAWLGINPTWKSLYKDLSEPVPVHSYEGWKEEAMTRIILWLVFTIILTVAFETLAKDYFGWGCYTCGPNGLWLGCGIVATALVLPITLMSTKRRFTSGFVAVYGLFISRVMLA